VVVWWEKGERKVREEGRGVWKDGWLERESAQLEGETPNVRATQVIKLNSSHITPETLSLLDRAWWMGTYIPWPHTLIKSR
jgi:hypothetical protein